ncbi:MAG TPA: PDZ domain-containing protein [Gemmatimonadaceae bacterium]|nr:PDZ domain-containing protein [Gemmatimonadaceae bacterium]
MRTRYGRVCAVVMAASVLATPLMAQEPVCYGCASAEQAQIDQARRDLDRANRKLMAQMAALAKSADDTSGALRAALEQAEQELAKAQRSYQIQVMRAMQAEVRRGLQAGQAERAHARRLQGRDGEGWLGITLSSRDTSNGGNGGEESSSASALPVVVSVDPGSPADRAGLEAGDRLIVIDGHNLHDGAVPLSVLRPGTSVPIRIRRGAKTKSMVVIVGRRPKSFMYDLRIGRDSANMPLPATPAPDMPLPAVAPKAPARTLLPTPAAPTPWAFPSMNAPRTSLWMSSDFFVNGVATIAGAQLWRVNALKDYFHVDDGLLVLATLPGAPAERAGLRSGDVIVRAAGKSITSVRMLEQAIERADDGPGAHTLRLDVVRKGKALAVALRW